MIGVALVLMLSGGAIPVPVGGEAPIPVRGAVEARVVNPTLASVVKVTEEAVVVRGEREGDTSVVLLTPEGYKEVALKVRQLEGEEPEVTPPQGEGVVPEVEPLPLTVFLGQPEVALEGPSSPLGEASPIEVSLRADKGSAVVDEKVSLSVEVRANQPLKGVEVRLFVPEGAGYLLGSGGEKALFDLKERAVVWRLGDLEPGEGRLLPCQVRVLKDVPSLSFVAEATAQGMDRVLSREIEVKVGRLVLAAIYALPDTFVVRRNVFSSLPDVKDETNRGLVLRLEGLGIIHGYPDKTFRPERSATRAEAAKAVLLADMLEGFADRTSLFFVLTSPAEVTVNIKDRAGRTVRTLVSNKPYDEGQHMLEWDGRDSQGIFVAPGVYSYEVSAKTKEGQQVRLLSSLTLLEARSYKPAGKPSFRDVPSREWYVGYVAEAERRGLAKGYPDGTFKPSIPINRAEFATLLVRAADLEEEAQGRGKQALGIADEDSVPAWARGYIAVALSQKLRSKGRPVIGLREGAFEPLHFVKRMEMVASINRLIDRDVEREISLSGAASPGAGISVNGRRIPIEADGTFRCRVMLKPGANVVAVIVR